MLLSVLGSKITIQEKEDNVMNKWAAAAVLALSVPMASAKVLISIDGGLGYNFNSLSDDAKIGGDNGVELASDNKTNGLNMDADGGFYGWAKISLPVLPDVKLKYENLKLSGDNTINYTIPFGEQSFDVAGDVSSELDLSYLDFALTYGIPLPMVNIDLGINTRSLLGGLTVEGNIDGVANETKTVDFTFPDSDTPLIIPMAYVSVAGKIPTIDLTLSGELSTLPLGDTNITDWNIKGIWYAPLPTDLLVKFGIEAGFRHLGMTIGESTLGADTSDLETDIGINTFFLGGTVHF